MLKTNPGESLKGTVRDSLKDIHDSTHVHDDREQKMSSVLIRVDIKKEDLTDPRPGATAKAKVYCGKRSIGYVWLYEVFEWFQLHVFF